MQLGRRDLKRRDAPEVDLRRVHGLTTDQFGDVLRTASAQGMVLHKDVFPAVLRAIQFQHVACVQIRGGFRDHDLEVGTAGQHAPLQPRPAEPASGDGDDAASAAAVQAGDLAGFDRGGDENVEVGHVFQGGGGQGHEVIP